MVRRIVVTTNGGDKFTVTSESNRDISFNIFDLQTIGGNYTIYLREYASQDAVRPERVQALASNGLRGLTVETTNAGVPKTATLNLDPYLSIQGTHYVDLYVSSGTREYIDNSYSSNLQSSFLTKEALDFEGLRRDLGMLYLKDQHENFEVLTPDSARSLDLVNFSEEVAIDESVEFGTQGYTDPSLSSGDDPNLEISKTINIINDAPLEGFINTGDKITPTQFGNLHLHIAGIPQNGNLSRALPRLLVTLTERIYVGTEGDTNMLIDSSSIEGQENNDEDLFFHLENFSREQIWTGDRVDFTHIRVELEIGIRSGYTGLNLQVGGSPTVLVQTWEQGPPRIGLRGESTKVPAFFSDASVIVDREEPSGRARSLSTSSFPDDLRNYELVSLDRDIHIGGQKQTFSQFLENNPGFLNTGETNTVVEDGFLALNNAPNLLDLIYNVSGTPAFGYGLANNYQQGSGIILSSALLLFLRVSNCPENEQTYVNEHQQKIYYKFRGTNYMYREPIPTEIIGDTICGRVLATIPAGEAINRLRFTYSITDLIYEDLDGNAARLTLGEYDPDNWFASYQNNKELVQTGGVTFRAGLYFRRAGQLIRLNTEDSDTTSTAAKQAESITATQFPTDPQLNQLVALSVSVLLAGVTYEPDIYKWTGSLWVPAIVSEIPDGSITAAKLSAEVQNILNEADEIEVRSNTYRNAHVKKLNFIGAGVAVGAGTEDDQANITIAGSSGDTAVTSPADSLTQDQVNKLVTDGTHIDGSNLVLTSQGGTEKTLALPAGTGGGGTTTPTLNLTKGTPRDNDAFRFTAVEHLSENPDLDFFVDARLPVTGSTSARVNDKNVLWVLQHILTLPQATPYDVDTKQRLPSSFISQASPGLTNPHNLGTLQAADIALAFHEGEPRMVFADNNGQILRSFKVGTTDYDAARNISFGSSSSDVASALAYDTENSHLYVIVNTTIKRYLYTDRTPVDGTIDLSPAIKGSQRPQSLTIEGNRILVSLTGDDDIPSNLVVYDKATLAKIDNIDETLPINYLSSLGGIVRGVIADQHLVKAYTLRTIVEEHRASLEAIKKTVVTTDNLASKVLSDASDTEAPSEKAVLAELINSEVLYQDTLPETARQGKIVYLGTAYQEDGARQDGVMVVADLGSGFRGYSKATSTLYTADTGDINPHDADAAKNTLAEAQILAVAVKSDTIRIESLTTTFKAIKTVQLGNRTYHLPSAVRTQTTTPTTTITSFDLGRASINIGATIFPEGVSSAFNIQFEDDTWLYEDGRSFAVGAYRMNNGTWVFIGAFGGTTVNLNGENVVLHSPTRVARLPISPLAGNEVYVESSYTTHHRMSYSTIATRPPTGFMTKAGWAHSGTRTWGNPAGATNDSNFGDLAAFLAHGLTGNCSFSLRQTSNIYYKVITTLPGAREYTSTAVCGSSTQRFGVFTGTGRITEILFTDSAGFIRYYKFDESAGPPGETTTTPNWLNYYVEDLVTYAASASTTTDAGRYIGKGTDNVKSYVLEQATFDIVQDLASRHHVDRRATVGHGVSIGISRRSGITPTQTFPDGTPSNVTSLLYQELGSAYPNSFVLEVTEPSAAKSYTGHKFRMNGNEYTWQEGRYENGRRLYHFPRGGAKLPNLQDSHSTTTWDFNFEDRSSDRYPIHDILGVVWLWSKKQT